MLLPHGYTDGHVYLNDGLLIETLQEYIYWYEVRKAIRSGKLPLQAHGDYKVNEAEVVESIWSKIVKEYGKPVNYL